MKRIDLGNIGETAVCKHLKRKGFKLVERNYRKKWGEIDLILKKGKRVHFVEVKTVSCENNNIYVSRETNNLLISHETWRPEDNAHRRKLQRFHRAVLTWLSENRYYGEWQIDVASVRLNIESRSGTIKIIDDVILE